MKKKKKRINKPSCFFFRCDSDLAEEIQGLALKLELDISETIRRLIAAGIKRRDKI